MSKVELTKNVQNKINKGKLNLLDYTGFTRDYKWESLKKQDFNRVANDLLENLNAYLTYLNDSNYNRVDKTKTNTIKKELTNIVKNVLSYDFFDNNN